MPLPYISPELIQSYQKEIEKRQSPATAKRKTASLKRFFDWAEGAGQIEQNPFRQETLMGLPEEIAPEEKPTSFTLSNVLKAGILGALVILIFLLARNVRLPIPFNLIPALTTEIPTGSPIPQASPAGVPSGVAILSPWTIYAKMSLKDSSGNPVTGPQTITFKLYSAPTDNGNPAVWSSKPETVTPDANGNSFIALDNVPTEVFFKNEKLYLAPVTDSTELSQRIPISTANVASNLQGYYPSTSSGPLTIPVIDENGALVLASQSPAVKGIAGNLLIEGQAVTITTPNSTDGNITLAPGGAGNVSILGSGTSSGLSVSNANLSGGSLITGVVANNASGYNLIQLQSGSTPTTKFSVDSGGNTTVAGNLNLTSGNLQVAGVTRLNSLGRLSSITGYYQDSGTFAIDQGAADYAKITKTTTSSTGASSADLLTLLLDESASAGSGSDTLVLKRLGGTSDAMALYVASGNAKFEGNATFEGQVQLGRFSSNPTAIGQGSLFFNTSDNQPYIWNGTSWVVLGGGSATSLAFSAITSGTNTTAAMVVGSGASLTYTGSGTINASSVGGYGVGSLPYVNNTTDTTLTRSGAGPYTLGLNLGNANTWTGAQTFSTDTYFPGSGIWNTSGNVGIGTTNPGEKLDVNGNLQFSGALMPGGLAGTSGYVLASAGAGSAPVWTAQSGLGVKWNALQNPDGTLSLNMGSNPTYFTWTGGGSFAFDTNGNVGIGTTNPGTAKLAVMGGNVGIGTTGPTNKLSISTTTNYDGLVLNGTNGNLAGKLAQGDNNGYFALYNNGSLTTYINGASGANSYFNSGGNVGIGTTSPAAKLDVNGTTWLRGTGTSGLFVNSSGNVGIGTTNPGAKLDVQGNVRLGQALGTNDILDTIPAGGDPSGILYWGNRNVCDSSGNCTGGSGGIGGAGNQNRVAKFTNTNTIGNSSINDLLPSGVAMTIDAGGQVGIGTTNPGEALDVAGNLQFSQALMPNGQAGTSGQFLISQGTDTAPVWSTTLPGSTTLSFANLTSGTNTSAAMVVGVGASLTYHDGVATSGEINASLLQNADWSAPLAIGSTTPSSGAFTTLSSTSGTNLATSTGSVGIGTTNPGQKLDVEGNIQFSGALMPNSQAGTSGYVLTSAGTDTAPTWTNPAILGVKWNALQNPDGALSLNMGSNPTYFSWSGGGVFAFDTNGNVGIGTTAPSSPLSVGSTSQFQVNSSGAIAAATGIASSGNIDLSSLNAGGMVKAAVTTGRLSIASGGTDYENPLTFSNGLTRSVNAVKLGGALTADTEIPLSGYDLIFTGTGNVGIGITNPFSKLQVGGAVEGKALVTFDETGDQNILTASASGATKLSLGRDGSLLFNQASPIDTTTGTLTLGSSGTSTTGYVQIGGPASITPDLLVLGKKSDAGNPTGMTGAVYINSSDKVMINEGGTWKEVCNKTDQACGTGTGSAWSALTNPTGNLALEMGIRTTSFNWSTGTGANDLFSFSTDASANGTGSLVNIVTGAGSTVLPLRVRAGSTEGLTVDDSGNVGIGITSPAQKLDVVGNLQFSQALMPNSQAGTSGQFLISQGAGTAPVWTTTLPSGSTIAFDKITSGTNTTAAMVVGTGASLTYHDGAATSGEINASLLQNADWSAPLAIGSTTPSSGAFTTLSSSGNSTIGTGASTTNTFGSGASSVNTIGSTTTPGALTLHGATTLDNTFTVSGSYLTSLGGDLTVTGTSWTATPTISGLITATSGLTSNGNVTIQNNSNLSLASGTGVFSQTFTGTTTTAATITASSLTSGKGLAVTSAATGLTGTLADISLTGNNAANTGTVWKASSTGASNTGTVAMITNLGTGYSFRVNDETGDTDSTPFVIDASGNVGVGTTTPGQKLDVAGNLQFSQALMPNGQAGTLGYFLVSGGAGVAPTWSTTLPPSTTISFANLTSGTNTSAAMVVGTGASLTYHDGAATSGEINASLLQNADWSAPLAIGSTTPSSGAFTTLTASNTGASALDVAGGIYAGSSNSFQISTAGAIAAATGIVSSGNIDLSSLSAGGMVKAAATTGRLSIASGGTDYEYPLTFSNGLTRSVNAVKLGGTLTANTDIPLAGYKLTFSGTTGNVGIGTTNPTTLLQLGEPSSKLGTLGFAGSTSGLVTIQPAADAGTWTLTLPTSGGTSGYLLQTNGSGTTTWVAPGDVGTSWSSLTGPSTDLSMTMNGWKTTFTWTGGGIFAFDSAGNVGIGTSSPANKLEVSGNADITGNLGVGTTNPGQKLDVAGNLQFSQALMPNAQAGTSGQFLISQGAGTAPVWTTSLPSGSTIAFDKITSGTNTSAAMVVGTGASLTYHDGVATSGEINASLLQNADWSAPLAIGSTTPSSGAFTTLSANSTGNALTLSGAGASINFSGAGLAQIKTAASQDLALMPGGKVGIGISSPAQALDIVGNLQFSQALMPNGQAGTSGQFLTSAGAGVPPTWTSSIPATSVPFSGITSGTNTSAAMVVGTGASLTYHDGVATSGEINASLLQNADWSAPLAIGSTTPSSGAFTTLTASNTGASALDVAGGIYAGSSNSFQISTAGAIAAATGIVSSGNIDLSSLSAGGIVEAAPTTGRLGIATGGTDYEFPLTFSNGLTRTLNAVKLGGTLTANTDVPLGGYKLTFSGSGYVGIGTTNPSSPLSVGSTSQFQVDSSGAIAAATGIVSSGNIDLSSLNAGGMVKAAVTTGRLSIASGGTDYENPLTFSNGLTRSVNAVKLGGTLTANTDIPLAGYNLTFSGTTGNVGIGTTSPGAKLDVAGRIWQTGTGQSVFLGEGAGASDDLSNNANVFVGYQAGYSNTTGYWNTANGYGALTANTLGHYNTANGYGALNANTIGDYNTANGMLALNVNTTGSYNTANGAQALNVNTTGSYNTANGMLALTANTTGYDNTANGYRALNANTTGYDNTANGYRALYSLLPTSKAITAFADYSGTVPGTVKATSVGHGLTGTSTKQISGTVNYNGSKSITVIDADSFYFTATWAGTETGWWAIDSEGRYNTAEGVNAGRTLITGDSNTFLGYGAGYNASQLTSASNSMALGNGAYTTASNQVVIGNTSITQTLLNGNVGIGTTNPSSLLSVGSSSQFQVNTSGAIAAATGIVSSGNIDLSSLNAGGMVKAAVTTGRLSIASGGTDYENPLTFSNGLTRSVNAVKLGGTLTANTDIPLAGYKLTFSGSGNVGIGTTNPTELLDIAGDTRLTTGTLQIGNQTNTTYNRIASSASTANGLNSANDLFIEGKLELNGAFYLNGGNIANAYGSSTIHFCVTASCSSTSQTENMLTAGSWVVENPAGTGNVGQAALMVNQAMTNRDIFTASASGTPKFTIDYGGNVGIGTTSPDNLLSLNKASGDPIIDFRIANSTMFSAGVDDSDSDQFKIEAASTLGGATPAFVITQPGHIGMGVSSPSDNVDIEASGPIVGINNTANTSYSTIRFQEGSAGSYTNLGQIIAIGSNFATAGRRGNLELSTANSSSNLLLQALGGNVGIGTTGPFTATRQLFTVSGGYSYFDADLSTYGGKGTTEGQLFVRSASDTNKQMWLGYDDVGNYGVMQAYQQGTSARNIALNPAGGNVGIGTTSPGAVLTVAGNNSLDEVHIGDEIWSSNDSTVRVNIGNTDGNSFIRFGQSATALGSFGWVYNATEDNSYFQIQSNPTTNKGLALQPSGGKVGIGTASPGYTLDVAGDINYTGGIYKSGVSGVPQADLKTTTGEVSTSTTGGVVLTLPGGSYGFYPQLKASTTGVIMTVYLVYGNNLAQSYTTYIFININSGTGYAQQRYVQSSPPYFIDGYLMKYFLYVLRDKNTNRILATYSAEDPPWENNGKDPVKVPHPFYDYYNKALPANLEIDLIDPTNIEQWKQEADAKGLSLLEYVNQYLTVDPTSVTPPTSPQTGQPIQLPGKDSVTWREMVHKTPEELAQDQTMVASPIQGKADLAETYPVGPLLSAGDIVEPTKAHVNDAEANDPLKKNNMVLEKTSQPNGPAVVGVISTDPAQIINVGGSDGDLPLALAGRVPTKVTNLVGRILIGDSITSSSLPGIGMKSTKVGTIVGKALEEFNCNSYQDCQDADKVTGWVDEAGNQISNPQNAQVPIFPIAKIDILINVSWNDPDVYLASTGDLKIVVSSMQQVASKEPETASISASLLPATSSSTLSSLPKGYQLLDAAGQVIDRIGGFAELVVASLRAGAIETKELIADNVTINNQIISPVVETNVISPVANEKDIHIRIGKQPDGSASGQLAGQTAGQQDSSTAGRLIVENASGSAVASVDEAGNATFEGTVNSQQLTVNSASVAGELYADKIHSTTLDDIQKILSQVETDQQLLTQAGSWNVNTATGSASLTNQQINQLTVNDLFVTDTAALNSLSVTSSLALGTDMVLQSSINQSTNQPVNSINTLSAPFSLQSLALAPVEIMAGKIKIDTSGNVTIQGNLYVAGNIKADGLQLTARQPGGQTATSSGLGLPAQAENLLTINDATGSAVASINASGSAQFNEVTTNKLVIAGGSQSTNQLVNQSIIESNATAGSAVVPTGLAEITIKNPNISDNTLVYVTPTSSTLNNVLYVKSKGAGFFTVGFENSLNVDVSFNWWLVEVKQP